jgi:hypothetical protein
METFFITSEDKMRLEQIPEALFQEFSEKVGRGEKYEGVAKLDIVGSSKWTLQEIDPKIHFSGLNSVGAFGLMIRRDEDSPFKFAVWGRKPVGDVDSIGEPESIFSVKVQVKRDGMWVAGKGSLMREKVSAEFSNNKLFLQHFLTPLILEILKRA